MITLANFQNTGPNNYIAMDQQKKLYSRIYNSTGGSTYNRSGMINVVDNCIGFMFTNLGDVIARVNDMVIFPSATPATSLGDSRSIMAHEGDIYKGNLKLSFDNPTAGVAPLVEIVQLFYVDIETIKAT